VGGGLSLYLENLTKKFTDRKSEKDREGMAKSFPIWSTKCIVFDKSISDTQNVILSHGRMALQALVNRIDRLHTFVAAYPQLKNLYPHSDIPATLSDLCFQQGIASTILFNDGRRREGESTVAYKLRLDRVAYVRQRCSLIATAVLSNRKIRNSLTHIDEQLAKALTKENTGWFIDVAISRRDEFTPLKSGTQIAFCRTYIASEDVILHLGNEISLRSLRQEANDVLMAIWQEPPHEPPLYCA
jgi:hypothetical protein